MKKLTWPFIFLFLIAFTAIVAQTKKLSNEKQANVPSVKNASFVDTPKQYVYRFPPVDAAIMNRITHVIDSLMNQWGVEKGGTEIKKAQMLFTTHFGYWVRLATFDSIPIHQPSKPNTSKSGK